MSAVAHEYQVQDAVHDLSGRFLFWWEEQGDATHDDLVSYLEGQGFGREIAFEAVARFARANDP